MCGIAGTGRPTTDRADGTEAENRLLVGDMLRRLTHRGPDADGLVDTGQGVLGHRRLSIVDLDGGDQPLVAGDVTLVANGEIYNAPELRSRLDPAGGTFRTGSDNEVILHLIDRHGSRAVTELRGMFAFALATDDDLVLGRDPLGIKPLYFGRLGGELVFASELSALPAGTVDVAPVEPGTVWSRRSGTHRYYRVPDPAPASGDLRRHAERVRSALEGAVQRRLMSDVPVGAFLSGGLDSSAIVALLRPHVEELHTFSVGLPDSPDLAAARLVADHLGTEHHVYQLDPDEMVAHLPDVVRSLESFDQDLVRSAVPTWFTARLAARHVKVVLTGEGADELFAGYKYHRALGDDDAVQRDARRSLTQLHHVNLQRVDRLTMAHSLEARVPFLDLDVIETALSIPPGLRRPGTAAMPGAPEKAVLRLAVEDLLPHEVVWRDKAQFDEGTGAADLLPELCRRAASGIDAGTYRAAHPDARLRSAEECWYHQLLVSSLPDPNLVLGNVARWTDR